MDFVKDQPTDDNGYGQTEGAILPILNGRNFHVQGIGFLGQPKVGPASVSLYFVAFAKYASGGHVSGCWLGVDLDRTNVFGSKGAITGFQYQQTDGTTTVTNQIRINDTVIGVRAGATNAPSQFNVIVASAIPIEIEGNNTRISGNFLGSSRTGCMITIQHWIQPGRKTSSLKATLKLDLGETIP